MNFLQGKLFNFKTVRFSKKTIYIYLRNELYKLIYLRKILLGRSKYGQSYH